MARAPSAAVKVPAEDDNHLRRFIELTRDYEIAGDRIAAVMRSGSDPIDASKKASAIGKELWDNYRELASFVATMRLART
jgi:hypothetical protein